MEKNKFFTFVLSFIPGAGHMYLDMMKKGTGLMSVFCIFCFVPIFMNIEFLLFILPVAWFYCFFDTFHVAKLDRNERIYEDDIFWSKVENSCQGDMESFCKKQKKTVGVVLIFISIYAFCYGILMPLVGWNERFWIFGRIIRSIPTLLVIISVFRVGQHLLKKDDKEDFVFYEKEKNKEYETEEYETEEYETEEYETEEYETEEYETEEYEIKYEAEGK